MYNQPIGRKQLIKRIMVYAFMVTSVISIATFLTFFMLGYRFDLNKGDVQQYSFLQFSSIPSGATVSIDGVVAGSKTPNKATVVPGKHDVVMWRDGYQTWRKSVDIKAGTLTWLNYALLVPTKLSVESIEKYGTVYLSLASPNGNYMLVQQNADKPVFDLVDLSSDTVKSTGLTIPSSLYSQAGTVGVSHTFRIEKWDESGRYVLISHVFGSKTEWLVMDTQNVASTKNITSLLNVAFTNIVFSGTSGNSFYVLDAGNLRKLEVAAGTVSKPLISGVSSFDIFNDSKVITYVASGKAGTNERVVGIYRDGDDKPAVVRTVNSAANVPFHIATTHYFNQDYIAISEGKKVDILSGSYPNTTSDNANSMKVTASFETEQDVNELTFSPIGQYALVRSGSYFASYNLEYQKFSSSNINGASQNFSFKWLDHNYLWSDRDDQLVIREFDGANAHTINSVVGGQDVALTQNGRFIYSIGKTSNGFQLQRTRMILP